MFRINHVAADPSLVMPTWKNKLDTGGIDATGKDPECTELGNI